MKRIIPVLLFIVFLIGCSDEKEEGYYRFKITSTGNRFFAIYTIDAEKDYYISEEDVKQQGNYFYFDQILDNPSTIAIKVDGLDYNETTGTTQTTRIGIELFVDDELVKETYLTASSYDQHLYLTLYYEFSGSNDDDDTDDDTDSSD